jgi:hypothetical protein
MNAAKKKSKIKKLWGLPANLNDEVTERVSISPEIASLMLQHNEMNRPMSVRKVARIAAKMKDRDWVFTHQGIAFSKAGTLLDGQHRLAAVIDADKTYDFLVTYGLDQTVFNHIDTGGTRSAKDLLAIQCPDLENRTQLCAMGNMMLRGIKDREHRSTSPKVVEFVDWYQNIMVPIVKEMKKCYHHVLYRGPVLAAFGNAVRGQDEWTGGKGSRDLDLVLLCAMRFAAEEFNGKKDPLRVLQNKLLKAEMTKGATGKLTPLEQYAVTVSALRAEFRGKTLTSLSATEIDWGMRGDYGQRRKTKVNKGGK